MLIGISANALFMDIQEIVCAAAVMCVAALRDGFVRSSFTLGCLMWVASEANCGGRLVKVRTEVDKSLLDANAGASLSGGARACVNASIGIVV